MPKNAQYIVSWSPEQADYLLRTAENEAPRSVSEDGAGWLKWLEEHRAFAFHGRGGHLNLLKERRNRGSEGYWYAYQRHEGRMLKRYVGRDEQLSIARLEEIATLLANRDHAKQEPGTQTDHIAVHGSGTSRRAIAVQPVSNIENVATGTPASQSNTHITGSSTTAIPMQFEALLLPKLQVPRLQKSLLPREHLLDLLDKGLEHKLTLIAGPAGYGKTTLVGQWITRQRARANSPCIAYLALDEGDNDPISFWRYIIAACQQFRPQLGQEALQLLLAHRLPPFKPLHMMLTSLLNELSGLEQPAVLVLDDFHVIGPSQVTETFSFLLDHLPTLCHLIMLIRGDPPFSLARLRARNELLDIHPPYLGFSLEETRAFFAQELSFTLSPQMLRQIYERLDGWPAGLRLLARELHGSDSSQKIEQVLSIFAGSSWSIQDYFLSEVLHTLPTEQQEFLLQTSILPRLTASLCDAITERRDSARQIEALLGGDRFLIPLDSTGEWSRYHSLFAQAMQQEARRCLGDALLRHLAARASVWYEEHGLLAEAIETALNAAEFARSASLLRRFVAGKQLGNALALSELYNLKGWLDRMPPEELERHPDLCIHYAMILLFVLMEESRFPAGKERVEHLLQVAEQKWRDTNKIAKLAEVFAFRALLAHQEGKMLQAVTWARQSLAWLPREDRTWRTVNLTVVGIGEILDGQLDNARPILLEALSLNELQGNRTYARAVRGMLGWVSFEQGELRHTCEQLRQIQAEARIQEDRDDIARTQVGLARIAY